jgi:deazaflavin-dependent oxidoreductase (nitroreductase family)
MNAEQVNQYNRKIIEEFRSNNGVVGGDFAGAPMLLLTTTGVKSGQPRTNPLVYLEDGDRLVVIASFAGAAKNPHWYGNLVANPDVTVEVGTERFQARAATVTGAERQRLFDRQAERMPVFKEYARKTQREIPVVTLTRA